MTKFIKPDLVASSASETHHMPQIVVNICHLEQRVPGPECLCGPLLLQAGLLRCVAGRSEKEHNSDSKLIDFQGQRGISIFCALLTVTNQEVLAVYLQNFPDSAIAINLKACNHFRWGPIWFSTLIIFWHWWLEKIWPSHDFQVVQRKGSWARTEKPSRPGFTPKKSDTFWHFFGGIWWQPQSWDLSRPPRLGVV